MSDCICSSSRETPHRNCPVHGAPEQSKAAKGRTFDALYEAVTAQLEHEFDAAGYDGEVGTLAALERIKAAVVEVRDGD